MPAVASDYAAWLQDQARYRTFSPGALPSGLQAMAVDSELITPFAASSAADTEVQRQLNFLGSALAADNAVVKGRQSDLAGRVVTLKGDQLGYDAGITVLVISAQENEDGTTQLLVLRKL